MNDDDAHLHQRIEELTAEVAHLRGLVQELQSPLKPFFLARRIGSRQWQEQTVVGGSLEDFPGGRLCSDDAHPSAAVEAPASVLMVQIADGNDYRYVPFTGGGAESIGQHQEMVHKMVVQNQDGWGYVQAHSMNP